MEADLYEEEMEDVILDYEREHTWGMAFEDNKGGVHNEKVILHPKMWDVYINEKQFLTKGGNYVEVSGYDGKKVVWGVLYSHVVEELRENDEIGLRFFEKYGGGDRSME